MNSLSKNNLKKSISYFMVVGSMFFGPGYPIKFVNICGMNCFCYFSSVNVIFSKCLCVSSSWKSESESSFYSFLLSKIMRSSSS